MPTSITSTKGTVFHLWQLTCVFKDLEESIWFSELENDLGDSYYAIARYGSAAGNKEWKFTLPTLTGSNMDNRTATGPDGETLSYADYLWSLYCSVKGSGSAFVYQSSRNNQYYLVRFSDTKLTYQRMLTQLYSTGVGFQQFRITGETVYDLTQNKFYISGGAGYEWYNENTQVSPAWRTAASVGISSAPELDGTNCTFAANPQNGHNTVRLTAGSSSRLDHKKLGGTSVLPICDLIIVLKVRTATFSGAAGIICDVGNLDVIVGNNGDVTVNVTSGFKYYYNGVLQPNAGGAAPMNKFGIMHIRSASTVNYSNIRIGQSVGGVYNSIDVAEIYNSPSPMPMIDVREIYEYLAVKWQIAM